MSLKLRLLITPSHMLHSHTSSQDFGTVGWCSEAKKIYIHAFSMQIYNYSEDC